MEYYDDPANIEAYVQMADGYDGRHLMPFLRKHLMRCSRLLELGMGPGVDLDLLAEEYVVTGSDRSALFLERYRRDHPGADLVLLDARMMDIERRFDCIYSNKVLQHLTRSEVIESLRRQAKVIVEDGILFHAVWYGEGEEEHSGLRTIYYKEDDFTDLVGSELEIVESGRYAEIEPGDSLYVVLKRVAVSLRSPDSDAH